MKKLSILMFLVMISFVGVTYAGENQSKEADQAKVFSIYLIGGTNEYVLKDLTSVQFQNVACIKGKYVGKGWLEGKVVYVPSDKINIVYEFYSYEDYKAAYKKYYETNVKE